MTDPSIRRRTVLRTVGGIVIASTIAGCSNSGGGKSKDEVNYQDHPKNGQQCSGCQFFVPPENGKKFGKCEKVKGKIAPDAWCSLYSPK